MASYWDIVAGMTQTYRQSILFNLEKDDQSVNRDLVGIYYSILPRWLHADESKFKLTEPPPRPLYMCLPGEKGAAYFVSQYQQLLVKWVLDSLQVCEEGFAKHLYSHSNMFEVLQIALMSYRKAVIFLLEQGRDPFITRSLIYIMNGLLPAELRARLEVKPQKGHLFESQYGQAMTAWTLRQLRLVDEATAAYVYQKMSAAQH